MEFFAPVLKKLGIDAAAPAPFDGGMYAPKAEEIPAPFEAPRRHRRSDRRQGK